MYKPLTVLDMRMMIMRLEAFAVQIVVWVQVLVLEEYVDSVVVHTKLLGSPVYTVA
jgi:hypothetical protein